MSSDCLFCLTNSQNWTGLKRKSTKKTLLEWKNTKEWNQRILNCSCIICIYILVSDVTVHCAFLCFINKPTEAARCVFHSGFLKFFYVLTPAALFKDTHTFKEILIVKRSPAEITVLLLALNLQSVIHHWGKSCQRPRIPPPSPSLPSPLSGASTPPRLPPFLSERGLINDDRWASLRGTGLVEPEGADEDFWWR